MKKYLQMLGKFETGIRRASEGILWISYVAIMFLILMVVSDVVLRAVFNAPLPATVEMSSLILPIVVFCGLAYSLGAGSQIRLAFLSERLPQARRGLAIFRYVISLGFSVLLVIWGWRDVFWWSFVKKEVMLAAILLPYFISKFFLPFGTAFLALYFLMLLLKALSHQSTGEI
jgi:TRAP-type C4-dicarboxylate transport system permease small subunit